ncbi:GNAT family N-acetyltransferase [Sphingomonas profundi]|uniref:GNAT family N-acetyltransferase n=1 Tax=Alterirhizorhabdus profundi TaxID=2681549 RepID=UPI0012E948CC|nr:GNAT family N-acetyltransferase [Sphingomonas profundi]
MICSIRPAAAQDVPALAALKLATFRETFLEGGFAIPYPPADLAAFETASYAPAAVAREIADPGHATWVAEGADGLHGYAHVGPCKLPHPQVVAGAGELYQIYVRGTAQGTGLGRRLLDTALDHLAATRPGPVWLGAWSGNLRAHAVYEAKGFRKVGEYRFPVGSWHDEEYIFRRD